MTKNCETCRHFNEGYCTRYPKWEDLRNGPISKHYCGEHKAIPKTPKARLAKIEAIHGKRQAIGGYLEEQHANTLRQIVKDNKLDELTLCIAKEILKERS